ncbi:MAG: RES family NAD+ phosphorylase [bacterium]
MKLWRIATDTPDYTADDLSGKGAEITGGRWNRRGTPLLYASTSRALACLETFAHLNAGAALPLNRYLVEIDIPHAAWRDRAQFSAAEFVGWDAEPAGKVSLDWGTDWARGMTTLMAEVPSVIVPEESNVLINPAHADSAGLVCDKLRKWLYDPRLRLA